MASNSNQAGPIILTDGSTSFDYGVDSSRVTTIASELNPYGLPRNSLAWLTNGTTRGGGITTRWGYAYRKTVLDVYGYLFQGGFIYEPRGASPYLVVLISGVLYSVMLEDPYTVTDLTGGNPALYMPTTQPYAYFCQAEEFLIVQAGDYGDTTVLPPDAAGNYGTKPLFWDGTTLRRSIGITNTGVGPGTPGINEIPAATAMDYYQNRLWYAQFRTYSAGDIVTGTSGTAAYAFRDAVLNVTENPLCAGGDGFTVPTQAGNIRALKGSQNIDVTLGQGPLYIFTRQQVYALDVPVSRVDWIAAGNQTTGGAATDMPLQRIIQRVNGSVNDRSLAAVNGDWFYQSLEPSIRSLIASVRYYGQWGNRAIASNEERILKYNDRSILRFASGCEFSNRMLQTALPEQTDEGVIHKALIPLDFEPISSFGADHQPAWEGHQEGLDHFQLFSVDYNGLPKCFSLVRSRTDHTLQLWEITDYEYFDYTAEPDDLRITMLTESPAYNFNLPHKLKELVGGEIWLDEVFGTVTMDAWYRPDADPCWYYWHHHEFCVARNDAENASNEVYPSSEYSAGYKWPIVLPKPTAANCDSMNIRPTTKAYQWQTKIAITGRARIRAILLYGTELPKSIYWGLTQQNTSPFSQAMNV